MFVQGSIVHRMNMYSLLEDTFTAVLIHTRGFSSKNERKDKKRHLSFKDDLFNSLFSVFPLSLFINVLGSMYT